jgi:peroxiredoxin
MPLLVDAGLAVAKQYDAVMGVGPLKIVNRTVVGIGRDGTIAFYKRGMPATSEILAALPA